MSRTSMYAIDKLLAVIVKSEETKSAKWEYLPEIKKKTWYGRREKLIQEAGFYSLERIFGSKSYEEQNPDKEIYVLRGGAGSPYEVICRRSVKMVFVDKQEVTNYFDDLENLESFVEGLTSRYRTIFHAPLLTYTTQD